MFQRNIVCVLTTLRFAYFLTLARFAVVIFNKPPFMACELIPAIVRSVV